VEWLRPHLSAPVLLLAVAANLALGGVALARGAVSRSGFAGGVVVGTWILWFGGLASWALLLAFFLLGTGATRLGYSRKAAAGIAQEEGGRRGSRHAAANCATGMALATLLPFTSAPVWAVGLVSAFATATSDTLGSEIGQLYGKHPILPTTLRAVPPGTEGAVSVEGTLAGVLGSLVLAFFGCVLGLVPAALLWVPVVAAFGGALAESYVGAVWGRRQRIGNEAMNFLNTVVGAGLGIALALLAGSSAR
jgi:uncharacterized protein (TIGR00297 family)